MAPQGNCQWNEAGLRHYDGLVDALLRTEIELWVTLYHWDLPQALQNRGGWQREEMARRFADYAARVGKHFQGRVRRYFTFNEPQCFLNMGYGTGEHAPGLQIGRRKLHQCQQNAHSAAFHILKQIAPNSQVGLTPTGRVYYPLTASPEDQEVARKLTFSLPEGIQTFSHLPALEGNEDLDFIGVNLYHGLPARMGPRGPEVLPALADAPRTTMDRPVTPEALR